MSRLLVITGPPGAGKSDVAASIGERLDQTVVVTGDSFFGFLAKGTIEPWLPAAEEQNETVVKAAAAATAQFVLAGYETVFDGVVGPWFLAKFAKATGLQSLDYAILLPPVGVCVQRVMKRRDPRFTDEAATRHMHRDFARAEIDSRHIIEAVTASPHETAQLVLNARRAGALVYECRSP